MAKPSPGDKVTRILEAMQSSKELQNAIGHTNTGVRIGNCPVAPTDPEWNVYAHRKVA